MMIVKEGVDVALIISTVVLTHATYRAVPAEHKHRIRQAVRATVTVCHMVPVMIYRRGRWFCYWLAWTVTTPLRRQDSNE